MVKVFLSYTIGSKVDRLRAEKETTDEAVKVLMSVLLNAMYNDKVEHWYISSNATRRISDYDLID